MRKNPTEKVIGETKAIIRLHQFLRHECGLREAESLSAKELKELLYIIKNRRF